MPKTNLPPSHQRVVEQVKLWLETIVVGLNLCPFAKRELMKDRIRFFVSAATTEEMLVCDLEAELGRLERDPSIETTLIIHPQVLSDFFEYQQFLIWADRVLKRMGLRGVFQIASFHPDYQFLNSVEHAPGNYTNRSPYPMLHLLREDSLANAIANYPDTDKIPERNIAHLESLGPGQLCALFSTVSQHSEPSSDN
ncbi:DUF1415 domain-containing protein [uncultured Porticoccus sp.]|uniref:DUF1415 domain-containing protein n=1 Tax=uncultured Porticoccus sp. TaxID=1256050 RepID=UPI0030DD1C1A|tara:strand:- start:23443 stop:24030 length:588 start_codon:yes stop_codon:yes gene_type:complete